MKNTYRVTVHWHYNTYDHGVIEVEAENESDAESLALEMAEEHRTTNEWGAGEISNGAYEVVSVMRVPRLGLNTDDPVLVEATTLYLADENFDMQNLRPGALIEYKKQPPTIYFADPSPIYDRLAGMLSEAL